MAIRLNTLGVIASGAAALALTACQSNSSPPQSAGSTPAASSGSGTGTGGSGTVGSSGSATTGGSGGAGTTTTGTPSTGGSGTSTGGSDSRIPTLVSVNLQNVLNDLSVQLNVNRNNIPVSAQVPIEVAANVCGVSVSALAASIASGRATCTATTMSPQLTQAVQQQIASGGSVTGGPQTMGTPR